MPTKRHLCTDHAQIPPSHRTVHEQLDSMIAAVATAIAMVPGNISNTSVSPSDDRIAGASARVSWERCSQCQRYHNPSRRCRCHACGNVHHSTHQCGMSNNIAQRCESCHLFHPHGPCVPNFGPVPVFCAQCGRSHLPGARCKCRSCGRVHGATNDCQFVQSRNDQDAYEGAAFGRGSVTQYDGGTPSDECPYCGALFFKDEGHYVNCCRKGTIVVHQKDIPSAMLSLITDSHVHSHIRQYNAAVAMASVGYSGDMMGRINANAPGRPYVDGYGKVLAADITIAEYFYRFTENIGACLPPHRRVATSQWALSIMGTDFYFGCRRSYKSPYGDLTMHCSTAASCINRTA
jgi:hypothetical protein